MNNSLFERNPKKCIILTIFIFIILIGLIAEFFLRYYINYNPSYYTAFESTKGEFKIRHYPYGDIPVNSDGYPDSEFPKYKTKPIIGYIGDSILYGVGVGYGYRITEILAQKIPSFYHMNFGYVGHHICKNNIAKIIEVAIKHRLDKVIYIMNLNDLVIDSKDQQTNKFYLFRFKKYTEWLRGRSYLLTSIRYSIKNIFVRLGYESHGQEAYELFPQKNNHIIIETAKKIDQLNKELKKVNVNFLVVICPYEMQISAESEYKYRELGIKWEEGFIYPGPQAKLKQLFDKNNVKYIDAYLAFVSLNDISASRKINRIGQFFVYNKGDKLDWNHPNRNGHQRIAELIYKDLMRN